MYTESSGNPKAVSKSGYKGLMQIPFSIFYSDANILIGAHIFNEKLKQTKGNVIKAIVLYKGYPINSSRGIIQAGKVLALYNRLKQIGDDDV
jgi:soluble lytic murein transglycosylase-like protein